MRLEKQEMLEINGGGISGTLFSSIVRGINAMLDLGRSLGSAIRRLTANRLCQI